MSCSLTALCKALILDMKQLHNSMHSYIRPEAFQGAGSGLQQLEAAAGTNVIFLLSKIEDHRGACLEGHKLRVDSCAEGGRALSCCSALQNSADDGVIAVIMMADQWW